MCDNKWHSVFAHYESEQILLGIDDENRIEKISPQLAPGFVKTSAPLYIGGLPGMLNYNLKNSNKFELI